MKKFTIYAQGREIHCERRGDGQPKLIFTHGAVGGLETPEMVDFANGVSERTHIISFEGSTTSMPSRLDSYAAVIEHEEDTIAIGGRSMGSRAAALTAAKALSTKIDAPWPNQLVLVSFPLIGRRNGDSRAHIILDLPSSVEVLFVSGDQDSMCELKELNEVRKQMKARSWLLEIVGASHTMHYERDDETTGKAMREASGRASSEWLTRRDKMKINRKLEWNTGLGQVDDTEWV